MSDLQCAATVLVLAAGSLRPVPEGWRVALVYADGAPGTTARATALAAQWEVGVRPAAGVSLDAVLADLADEHRGECVVLVAAGPAVARLAWRYEGVPDTAVVVELDDDGQRVSAPPTGR